MMVKRMLHTDTIFDKIEWETFAYFADFSGELKAPSRTRTQLCADK